MKKFLHVAAIGILVPLSACSSPQSKIKQMEDAKAALFENSGYNACVAKIDANDAAYKNCATDKLVAEGYTDGIDCINNYNDPTCKKGDRYHAETLALNDCYPQFHSAAALTIEDCAKLLQQ